MQAFDPQAFLDLPVEAPLVKRPPIPAGDYTATIKDVTARPWQSKDKTNPDGSPKSGIAYDVALTIEVPEAARALVGLDSPTLELKDSIMLELNSAGMVDQSPGKNGALRRYREALDMNKPGETFRARSMVGRMLTVRIIHEEYNGDLFERVRGVAKIG